MPTQIATLPHTAITTWSGFVYQGKVALLYLIEFIDSNFSNCNGFKLQLDSLEDFAILNSTNNVVSLHQVKALKSKYFNAYKQEIEKLQHKSNQQNCSIAKFHVAQKISDKTPEAISSDFSPVELFKYEEDEYWCPLSKIDEKIEAKLAGLINKIHPSDPSKTKSDYLSKARSYLDQYILRQVMKIHSLVHSNKMSAVKAAYTQTISFQEILSVLTKDLNQENLGDDYYFYILLNDFFRYYQEYCFENDSMNPDELEKMSAYMQKIGTLDKDGLCAFFRNIMPQREFQFSTIRDYKDGNFTKDNLQHAFFLILQKLRQADFKLNLFFVWDKDGSSYMPTTINNGDSQRRNVCLNIFNNSMQSNLVVLFDGGRLITSDINVDSITDELPQFNESDDSKELKNNRISSLKKVSFVSLNKAEHELNE